MKENISVLFLEIAVWLEQNSQPVTHKNCTAYQKGDFYCVYHPGDGMVFKYPIAHIWRVAETYPPELRK